MTGRRSNGVLLLVALAAGACASPAQKAEGASPIVATTVSKLPESATRTFVDFGGKIQLVGFEVSPRGTAGPGESVELKLYWTLSSRLGRGWNLFTHLEDDGTRQIWNFDREGPLRTALTTNPEGLGALTPGKIYVDAQKLTLPKAEQLAPRVAIVVGVWADVGTPERPRDVRLPVLSGPSNGHEAGIVTRFVTGVSRPAPQNVPGQRPRPATRG